MGTTRRPDETRIIILTRSLLLHPLPSRTFPARTRRPGKITRVRSDRFSFIYLFILHSVRSFFSPTLSTSQLNSIGFCLNDDDCHVSYEINFNNEKKDGFFSSCFVPPEIKRVNSFCKPWRKTYVCKVHVVRWYQPVESTFSSTKQVISHLNTTFIFYSFYKTLVIIMCYIIHRYYS